MFRRFLAVIGLALAFVATDASAQSLTTYTFGTLPGSPTGGQLAWITDNSGTPTIGSPAAGGAGAGNRDLVAWDATQSRWEFVARQPVAGPSTPLSTLMDAVRIAYANGVSGAISVDVQSAIDELFAFRTAVQPAPSTFVDSNSTRAAITNPATTNFGFGVSFDNAAGFGDALKYPGGPAGNEPDNMIGIYYNKSGVLGSTILNPFEYSFDDSLELSYRAAATGHKTWSERNWDYVPPTHQSTLSSSTGAFAVGDWVSFSGGGSGRIVAVSGSNPNVVITWTHNFGTTAAAQTVTNITQSGGGTLGALTFVGLSYDLRALQFVYDTVDGNAFWDFNTMPNAAIATLRMSGQKAGVNYYSGLYASLGVETRAANSPALHVIGTPGSATNGADMNLIDVEINYGTTINGTNSTPNGRALRFLTPALPPGAANVSTSTDIEFQDQRGIGSASSTLIRRQSQSCSGSPCAEGSWGNDEWLGGNWNTGHLVFGGQGNAGDHLWRDQTNGVLRISNNDAPDSETDGLALVTVVASGTRALATAAIAAGACSTTDANITATGALSTDVVRASPNGDPGLNAGLLTYSAWAGANVISWRVCNPTAGSITPGAVTMNWRVER